jgi:rubredoxin
MNEPRFPALAGDERNCPVCKSDWQGTPIPLEHRDKYYGGKTHFHRLIGVEIQGKYDGVHHWKCPDCASLFPRIGISA